MHALTNIASGIRTFFGSAHGMAGSTAHSNSAFWQRKMLTHFKRMDVNADDFVSREDFKSLVRSLASKGRLTEPRAYQMQRLVIELWEDFWCCSVDKGYEYKVSTEEFLGLIANMLRMPESRGLLEQPLSLLFGVIDLDGDGRVNLREWTIYNDVVGISEEDAKHSFEICFGGKAEITKEDFVNVGQAFFAVTDERDKSRHLWGPLVLI